MSNDKLEHFLEHLFSIVGYNEAEAVMHYYGILDHTPLALKEIAVANHLSEEEMLEQIDGSLRKIAVTPEWQELRNMALMSANSRKTTYRNRNEQQDRRNC